METKVKINTSDIGNYNPDYDYFATPITGDCLNSSQCPIRIKDGDLLLCHRVDVRTFRHNWQDYKDAIIVVVPCIPNSLRIRSALAKQFVALEHDWFVVMRMFNPPQTIEIAIDEIEVLAIVDRVISQVETTNN